MYKNSFWSLNYFCDMDAKKKIVFVQNIITPYRCNTFNLLYQYDHRYEVFYMSRTENDRNWDIPVSEMKHEYWLDKTGIYFSIKGFHIHLNPVLISKILFSRNIGSVVLGASYCDVNILILSLFKRLRFTNKKYYCWAEANYLTNGARKDSRFKSFLRKFVYGCVDGAAIVPGKMAKITLEKWGTSFKRYIDFPNTIDESALIYNSQLRNKNLSVPIILMPVRLIENLKGLINFFDAIGRCNVEKAIFLVAGEGKDRELYEKYIKENSYNDHIKLLGFCNSEKMKDLYNEANLLVLPSISDPSPLTIVEALRFHLPILCSSHCGNHFEAVKTGVNGYTFSPLDKNDIKTTFEKMLSQHENWNKMGEQSAMIYDKTFRLDVVVKNLMKNMD